MRAYSTLEVLQKGRLSTDTQHSGIALANSDGETSCILCTQVIKVGRLPLSP